MICLDVQVGVYSSCLCISDMYPSFLEHFLTFWHKVFQDHMVIFPGIRLDSAIFPGSPGSFQWQIIFRSQVLGVSFIHCCCDWYSRPFQQTELGITCVCADLHFYIFIFMCVENYVFLPIDTIPFQYQRVHCKFLPFPIFN